MFFLHGCLSIFLYFKSSGRNNQSKNGFYLPMKYFSWFFILLHFFF